MSNNKGFVNICITNRFIYNMNYNSILCNYISKLYRFSVPRLSGGESKSLKNASIQMELHKTADCGNFVVANKKIDAGDVLVVEKPLAVCLLPKFFGSHCVHCMKR